MTAAAVAVCSETLAASAAAAAAAQSVRVSKRPMDRQHATDLTSPEISVEDARITNISFVEVVSLHEDL